jgi:hypothetical protein
LQGLSRVANQTLSYLRLSFLKNKIMSALLNSRWKIRKILERGKPVPLCAAQTVVETAPEGRHSPKRQRAFR